MRKHPKMVHLSDEEIEEVVELYYSGRMKVAEIIEKYDIRVEKHSFIKVLPPIELDKRCPICGAPFYLARGPRKRDNMNIPQCLKCGHVDHPDCGCDVCYAEKAAMLKKKRAAEVDKERRKRAAEKAGHVKKFLKMQSSSPVELVHMSFKDRVYLAAILRYATTAKDRYNIIPVETVYDRTKVDFASDMISGDIISYLHRRGLICVDVKSEPEAFIDVVDKVTFYTNCVKYRLNLVDSQRGYLDFDELLNPNICDIRSDLDLIEACEIWMCISVWDCVDYINYFAEWLNLFYKPSVNMAGCISGLLEKFTTAEVYWIIENAAKLPNSFTWENSLIKKEKAIKAMCASIKKIAKELRTSGFTGFEASKSCELRKYMFNDFYYNEVLGIGEASFYSKITPDELLPMIGGMKNLKRIVFGV